MTDMIFVTGRTKRAIEDHFDKAYELETELEARGKTDMLEFVAGSVAQAHQLHLSFASPRRWASVMPCCAPTGDRRRAVCRAAG